MNLTPMRLRCTSKINIDLNYKFNYSHPASQVSKHAATFWVNLEGGEMVKIDELLKTVSLRLSLFPLSIAFCLFFSSAEGEERERERNRVSPP